MCGISGVHGITKFTSRFGKSPIEDLHHSLQRISHRGPEHSGIQEINDLTFGHNRLRILDLSDAADQPMRDDSGRYWIVFNGEIFNFQELKKDSLLEGYTFKTNSDTEVLLTLLIRGGIDILNKLNGFFAFAFYDKQENKLLLVRDRFGEKPLWYCRDNGILYFSSELKGLTVFPVNKTIDQKSLALYLQLTYIPAPQSIYEDIKKIEPGCALISENNDVSIKRWYHPNVSVSVTPIAQSTSELYSLLKDAVTRRLISDVPVGSFLSGGLDSSIISSLAIRAAGNLKTFSMSFPEDGYLDESTISSKVAKYIGSEHTTVPFTMDEGMNTLQDYLHSMDEPFADSSSIAVYFLSQFVKSSVTVALSGDGADELFGGYRKHFAFWSRHNKPLFNSFVTALSPLLPKSEFQRGNKWGDKMRQLTRYAQLLRQNHKDAYWNLATFSSDELISMVMGNRFTEANHDYRNLLLEELKDDLNSVLMMDQKLVLANDMLTKVDTMSMAHALEVRSPFLDYVVVEFANSLSANYKIHNGSQKWILKETFGKIIPEEVLSNPKKGFEIPIDRWLNGALKDEVRSVLADESIQRHGLFDRNAIRSITDQSSSKVVVPSSFIWSLYVFQKWYNHQE